MLRYIGLPVLGGVAISLTILLSLMVWLGLDDRSTPIAVTIAGAVMTTVTGLAAVGRAKDAAVQARRARGAAELSASHTAGLSQQIVAHCGEICPSIHCPLRRPEEAA